MENYTNHINKYANSTAIQAALDNGSLANPYVAMTTAGTLDFNSLQPTPPAPQTMGNWTEDGTGGHYFTITEEDTNYWYNNIYIGTLNNVYFGGTVDMDITLTYTGGWKITIGEGEHASDRAEHTFEEGVPDNWNTGVMVREGDSDANIYVEWFGDNTLAFYSGSEINPISITTHDPEYPAA